MAEKTITRRAALLGLGAAAASASMFRGRPVLAGGSTNAEIPKRIMFFYGGSGSLNGAWEPQPAAGRTGMTLPAADYSLGAIHAPLQDFKDRLIYIDNLDMVSQELDPISGSNAHIAGATHALTANNRRTSSLPGSISIDQFIAQRLNDPTPVTRLPTLDLYCTEFFNGDTNINWVSSDGRGNTIPQIWNPRGAYRRVFPDPPMMGTSTAGARRARVAAYVNNHFSTLNPRLSGGERAMLDEHRAALASLQSRLQLGAGRPDARPPESTFAALPAGTETSSLWGPWSHNQAGHWRLCTELNLTVAISALHADVTRVATLQVADPPAADVGYMDGAFGTTDTHDLTHRVSGPTPTIRDAAARAVIIRQMTLHMEMFAFALRELARRTEPDGSSLLEHTLLVYVSQIADGSHSLRRLPWIVAGNANGYFRSGRYIRFGRGRVAGRDDMGRPHNDLFVSLANAMDVNVNAFGNPQCSTGPIAEMR